MSFGAFCAGAVVIAVVLGGVLGATLLIVRHRLAGLRGLEAALACAIVATSLALGVHLIPLIAGLLYPGTVAVCAVVAFACAWWWARGTSPAPAAAPQPHLARGTDRPAIGAERTAVAISLAVAAGAILAGAVRLVDAPVSELDMLTWNLPEIARWIQDGSLWEIHEFVPYWGHDAYPHNGDVLLLGLVLPFDNDFLARTLGYGFLAVLGVAVYALVRELGARRELAATVAALVLAIPSVTLPTLVNVMPDVVLMGMFAAGLVFLVRHGRTNARSDLVLAGLALGIAFGTKWYGVTTVAATVLVWCGARMALGSSARVVARDGALLAGLVGLTGGFWLVRNLVLYGNPVYPASVPPLFDAPRDVIRELYGFNLFDYRDDAAAWRDEILPAFRTMFGAAGALLAAGALAGGIVAAVRSRRKASAADAAGPAVMLVAALLIAVIYALTPYSALGPEGDPFNVEANTRYATGALIAFAGAAAGLAAPSPWSTAFVMLGPIAVIATVTGGDIAPDRDVAVTAVGLMAAWLLLSRRSLRRPAVGRAGATLAGMAAVAAAAGATLVLERRFNDDRYGSTDGALAAIERARPGSRIALTGSVDDSGPSPVFPAFGPRLANHVDYLGVLVDGQLRPPSNEQQWRRLLLGGGYDLVLVGRADGVIPGPPVRAWAARSRLPIVVTSDRFRLYRVPTGRARQVP